MTTALATQVAFKEKPPEGHFGADLPDASSAVLQARIKDLELHLKGTRLERFIDKLYEELEAKGISLRPHCYLSDQWGCPSGVPVIGIPFYLADPKLTQIEDHLGGGAEDEREIMMYLRHEAGHALNYAYKLYETDEWKKLFGDFGKPYLETYKPQPFSRKYVLHISGWYAQKHPDEDFAETFAVWLTPDSRWGERYKGWGALKKLQYMDAVIAKLGRTPAVVTLDTRDVDVGEMEETVLDHYRQRQLAEKIDLQIGEQLDQDLINLFEAPSSGDVRADTLIRAERQGLIAAVTQYSGVSRAVVVSVLEHLTERTTALNLTVKREKAAIYTTRLTSLVTALAMNFLYTDRFFETD
ncbi:MAG: putative zinc-binding metallopeptidase [Myxococcaceae bacterium]|nr:putative zinc-binding metallopeptidase [Myxococcaceae bacterium]